MPVGHSVLGEPHLQGARKPARRVLDEMRQPVVGDRLLPVAQDLPGGGLAGDTQTAHKVSSHVSRTMNG